MATRDYPGGDLMVYLPRHPRGAEVACPGSGDSFGPDQVVPGPPENPLTDQEGPTSP
jgi:hypothetical protein